MKYLALVVAAAAISACSQMPAVHPVGQSQRPVPAVAQCIAQKWADASQTHVISQAALANNAAMDVYEPGQQPPSGSAALVRSQGSGSWVGLRSAGPGGSDVSASISGCL